jgi:hypothetical protein
LDSALRQGGGLIGIKLLGFVLHLHKCFYTLGNQSSFMNQPETVVIETIVPLQQYKGKLLSKGYSYREIKEGNAVTTIFRSADQEPVTALPLPPINEN